ncbi:MAG: formate dehydrogenase, partial [bacterium]|nr:formate dehydrogenase [bacterium]
MELTRRGFIKITGLGFAGIAVSQVGWPTRVFAAHAEGLKVAGAKEVITVCPFCSVICNVIAHVKDGKIINTEGDPGYPVSEGALCAKGSSVLKMVNSEHRLFKPLYRAPNSNHWEEKSWEWTVNRLAERIKQTRDATFIRNNKDGKEVNRTDSIFWL